MAPAPGRFTPAPRPILGTGVGSAYLDIAAQSATWLYDTARSWPGIPMYHHASGPTFSTANVNGVLAIAYPPGQVQPVYRGDILKTPGRNTLVVNGATQNMVSGNHLVQIVINSTLVDSFTVSSTSFMSFTRSFAIGSGAYGVADNQVYTVIVYVTRTSGNANPFAIWIDEVYGTAASIGLALPALPTFNGASTLNPGDVHTLLDRQDAIYNGIAAARIPGFSGVITGFFDFSTNPNLLNTPIRHFHYATRVLPGRRTLRLSGRLEGRSARTFTLAVRSGATDYWSQNYTNYFIEEPWEPVVDLSGAGLTDGSFVRLGLMYTPTNARVYPRPRLCLLDWALTGQDSSGLYADLPPLPVGPILDGSPATDIPILTYLQQLRNNTAAAEEVYNRAASVIERDWPWVSAWNTSARHALRPDGNPADIDRKEENPVDGPACFRRWGDLLHVYAVRPRIVWGPQTYKFADKSTGRNGAPLVMERVDAEQPHSYTISDDPDKAVFTTVHLGSVSADGATLAYGERFRVIADRILYCGQQLYGVQA